MTLRVRVLAMIAASVVLILALGWQLTVRYTQTNTALDVVVARLAPASASTNTLDTAINSMERRLRMYVTGGSRDDHRLYQDAVSAAGQELKTLKTLMAGDKRHEELISDTRRSLNDWLKKVGTPASTTAAQGRQAEAAALIDSRPAQAEFSSLTSQTYRLHSSIAKNTKQALAASAEAAQKLAWTLATALVLLMFMPLVAYFVLSRSVLRPIELLRKQLRAASAHSGHDAVIVSTGPPELRDLGRDAETLRRNLVIQIDESSAARTALEQEGPVVEAIRKELSARIDTDLAGVDIAGVLRPAEGVLAGDFWDRVPLGDGRTAIIICDVSGHGPRAGIVAMRIKTGVMMGLLAGSDPPTIFHRACDGFSDEPSRFATVVILIVDPRTGELTWANAGHPRPRVARPGGRIEHLGTTGPMLSWLGGAWTLGRTTLGPADVCLLFTDGILESRNSRGDELGDDELDARLIEATATSTEPAEVIAVTMAGVRQRAEDLGRDDLTLIAIRLDPKPTGAIPTQRR